MSYNYRSCYKNHCVHRSMAVSTFLAMCLACRKRFRVTYFAMFLSRPWRNTVLRTDCNTTPTKTTVDNTCPPLNSFVFASATVNSINAECAVSSDCSTDCCGTSYDPSVCVSECSEWCQPCTVRGVKQYSYPTSRKNARFNVKPRTTRKQGSLHAEPNVFLVSGPKSLSAVITFMVNHNLPYL